MAPKYKLTYINRKGIAEYVRYLLAYLGEDFEDVRLDYDKWKSGSLKHTTPFGRIPYLEVDGKVLTQTIAIARYLGKEAGLGGRNNWEDMQIDIMADTIVDLRTPITLFMFDADEKAKKIKRDAYVNDMLPFYMKKLDAVVKDNGGYLANKKLSWADFVFASFIEFVSDNCDIPDPVAEYPHLKQLQQTVFNLPQIKKWRTDRPLTIH
uniref:glutathione transferase n=1 Tax=Cuerna arida TaxID=1464854 RepID=A0A1B6EMN6_9HEMI